MVQKQKSYAMTWHVVRSTVLNVREKYFSSGKKGRSQILTSLVECTGRDRKHLIKLLDKSKLGFPDFEKGKTTKGLPLIYDKEALLPYIKYLWLQMERVSPGRMKEGLKDWLPDYKDCPPHLQL
jgi:hypothetical protein